jgi:sulfite dehydrogenase (quinone) subunit SoeA
MAEPSIDLHAPPGDEVKTTTCYMCACRCGIKVWLKDGQIRYIQGNPEHPVNRGVLCAKGSAGIMQHYSPARLSKPLKRVGPRGSGEFVEIEWDEALATAAQWLGDIRQRNPDELAFFTGRDQSQALTGWWAQAFGTVNYAAHGGFCSVNMAAGGLYSIGGSFWEFGEPDWDHTRLLLMWGVAEDHDSNPIKLGLGKLKARGAKIIAINPVRSGYAAIADEWIGIRPGTDGLLAFALIHELLRTQRVDLDYLVRYANAHWLVIRDPGGAEDGLFARDGDGNVLCAVREGLASPAPHPQPLSRGERGDEAGLVLEPLSPRERGWGEGQTSPNAEPAPEPSLQVPHAQREESQHSLLPANTPNISPLIVGEYTLPDGRTAVPVFQHIPERYGDAQYAPEAVAGRCGIPAARIRGLARELAETAFDSGLELPIAWTDAWGREHASMTGRPVAMHAMRGISAHSNGFHTCRALHLLQMLLGAIDAPGSFRYQPPFPKPIPPPNRPGRARGEGGKLDAPPLGFVHGPEDLVVDEQGNPRRIDHAYSWAYPLAAHGMLHTVIRNAWAGDPTRIDTLFLFMANMSWNSAMNTAETMQWLTDTDAEGNYRIPRIIYSDAYASEMVAYADLVLPDTTYLERHDCISLLDRPISDADGAADAIRHPVLAPDRDVRGFQSVLLELGARLKLPGLVDEAGAPLYGDYADYIVRHERAPGVGLLAGWRGDGTQHGKGAPNPDQIQRYIEAGGFWRQEIPEHARYYKMANRGYLDWAGRLGFLPTPAGSEGPEPIVLELYSERLQRFRLAAQGHGAVQPPDGQRERVATYFDPLPIWYPPFEQAEVDGERFPLHAITQRPMFMYHAWGSQNAWLRQLAARNWLYLHPDTGARFGIADGDWVELESHHGAIRVPCRFVANVQPDTVWTWNAIGKRRGAWKLDKDAPEGRQGFLLNHLISDRLPRSAYANADPVTGQAAWFDLRVAIRRVEAQESSSPQFQPLPLGEAPSGPLRYGKRFREEASGLKPLLQRTTGVGAASAATAAPGSQAGDGEQSK